MAQSLTTKIEKLAAQFNIDAIIKTAQQVKADTEDTKIWEALTTEQKTAWFMAQCEQYGLTTTQRSNQIKVDQLPEIGKHSGTKAYFTVFLPRKEIIGSDELSDWKLEIGGSYIRDENGGIWSTHPGLRGKEKQIAEVIRLNKLGK
jgi:hypothetical protein